MADIPKSEEQMKTYIRNVCGDVVLSREYFEQFRNKLIDQSSKLSDRECDFYAGVIGQTTQEFLVAKAKYEQVRRDVSLLCHFLGGEYIDMFNNIVCASEDKDLDDIEH